MTLYCVLAIHHICRKAQYDMSLRHQWDLTGFGLPASCLATFSDADRMVRLAVPLAWPSAFSRVHSRPTGTLKGCPLFLADTQHVSSVRGNNSPINWSLPESPVATLCWDRRPILGEFSWNRVLEHNLHCCVEIGFCVLALRIIALSDQSLQKSTADTNYNSSSVTKQDIYRQLLICFSIFNTVTHS